MAFDRQNLHFREVEPRDLEMLRSWRNDPQMSQGWHDPRSVQTLHQQELWYRSLDVNNQAFLGQHGTHTVGLLRFRLDPVGREARITGIDVPPQEAGHGYGKAILRAGVEYVLNDLGYHRATGEALACNPAAIKIILAAGFKQEGTLRKYVWRKGEWQDWHIYSLLREELWPEERGVAAG